MKALRCAQCQKFVHGECSVTARRVMPGAEACEYGKKLIAESMRLNGGGSGDDHSRLHSS